MAGQQDRKQMERKDEILDVWRRYRTLRPLDQPAPPTDEEWRENQRKRNNPYYTPNRYVKFVAR